MEIINPSDIILALGIFMSSNCSTSKTCVKKCSNLSGWIFRSDHHTHQHTHCKHNFYKHHTDGPLCNTHIHDTHHLFNCTHIRTTLSLLDLWTDPAGVTALLARWMEKVAGGPQTGTSDSPHKQGSWEWVDNNYVRQRGVNTYAVELPPFA